MEPDNWILDAGCLILDVEKIEVFGFCLSPVFPYPPPTTRNPRARVVTGLMFHVMCVQRDKYTDHFSERGGEIGSKRAQHIE